MDFIVLSFLSFILRDVLLTVKQKPLNITAKQAKRAWCHCNMIVVEALALLQVDYVYCGCQKVIFFMAGMKIGKGECHY